MWQNCLCLCCVEFIMHLDIRLCRSKPIPTWRAQLHRKCCSVSTVSCGSWSLSPSTQHEDLWTDLCDQDQSTVVPDSLLALDTNVYMCKERKYIQGSFTPDTMSQCHKVMCIVLCHDVNVMIKHAVCYGLLWQNDATFRTALQCSAPNISGVN